MVIPLLVAVVLSAAATGAVAGIAIAVARITYTLIMDFFTKHRNRVRQNQNLARITADVSNDIKSGNVKTIYTGLFDPVQQEFVESDVYESSNVDPRIAEAHEDSRVVIWN